MGRMLPDIPDTVTDCIPASYLHKVTGWDVSAAHHPGIDLKGVTKRQPPWPVHSLPEEMVDFLAPWLIGVEAPLCKQSQDPAALLGVVMSDLHTRVANPS